MRNLLNKLFTKLAKMTENNTQNTPKQVKTIVEHCNNTETNHKITICSHDKPDYDNMNFREVPREYINKCLEDIQAEIFTKGYKEIPDILNQYRTEIVQQFVMIQLIGLGQYNPEVDNLEQYNKDQLVKLALDNNQLQFEQRMIEQGKANITSKQIEILKKYNIKNIPTDRFNASRLIDKVLKENGIDTSKGYDGTVTQNQINTIKNLSSKIGLEYVEPKDRKEASNKIQELLESMSKLGIEDKATEAQIEYAKRCLKALNKRLTAKKVEELNSMSKQQISAFINELKTEYSTKHPEASQGQIDYIISLCNSLNIPYNINSIKSITSVAATNKIDELTRKLLFVLTRRTSPSVTINDINNMTSKAVRDMIKQIREENKTMDYTKDSDTKDLLPL